MADKIRKFIFALAAAFLCLLTLGFSQPASHAWAVSSIRWLGAADAPTAATDMIAVYTRTGALTVDIRVDLLDINPGDKYQFKLSFWDNRAFSKEPLVIELSSNGEVHTSGDGEGKPVIWPRVIQDFGMDTITISLNRFLVGDHYHMDLATYTTDPLVLADEARDIRSDGHPPVARAPVLVAFWDTFPADTPAQALRRWNGAHTGPYGDRHGLKNILDGAQQYKIPVALLDIKNPASLAALAYLGATDQIQSMAEQNLLILPDVAYAEPADISLGFSRSAATGFGLPVGGFVYSPTATIQTNYRAQFYTLTDASHMVRSQGTRLIPLPSAEAVEATADGPSLDVRRALVNAAMHPDTESLVVLGGSLPNSSWGDVDMAAPTFQWIDGHQWIKPLNGDDLLKFPVEVRPVISQSKAPDSSPWLKALRSAPDNAASKSAWQDYLTLSAPVTDPQLQALRADYLGQVGELLAAARWAKNPSTRADCGDELDADGRIECILSNQKFFAIIDPAGARLTNLFFVNANGVHQLVGPSSQFAVGLSDPSEWHPGQGEAADPSVIPGAFADNTGPWLNYNTASSPEKITFTSPDGGRVKTYRLTENGIELGYKLPDSETTLVPLAVDPQAFYFGPTNYRPAITPHSWTWSLVNGISVEVQTDAELTAEGFISSFPFLFMPEDPNLDYPKGHYIPFPFSVVSIQGKQNFTVQIIVK